MLSGAPQTGQRKRVAVAWHSGIRAAAHCPGRSTAHKH